MFQKVRILQLLQKSFDINSVLKKNAPLFEKRRGVTQDTINSTKTSEDEGKDDDAGGEKKRGGEEKEEREDKGRGSCVVTTLVGGVPEEQHLMEHHHNLMYGGSSLAAFVKRRRKEKELIKRFEEVESWVNERDPKLARDLYILREAHKAYEMTWCRIKYHPSLLKRKEEEEGEEEGVIIEEEKEEEEEEEDEGQEDIERLVAPSPDLSMGIKPPRIPPRINILWRVRLSAAEKERQERRRRLMEVREELKGRVSLASMNGSVRGGLGSLRAGSFVSLARQYQPRPVGLSSLTPLEAALDEETGLSHSRRSFLPVRKNSSSSFLPPPSYSALKRSGRIKVTEYNTSKKSLASTFLGNKTYPKKVTKVKPFRFQEAGRKRKHICTVHHF
ncbi:uncharacterized protein LOC123510075 isoform X1 [Portunus trituberculatus]|uniref:uncharacterized protein LOC123510075 isoform X1 n=1 Tax=Portunus trituberculatus TaxID=210409 RepID=UPI001E1D07D4|nr:uncharacterized protein LOC123510075 isoform X1 [Portunus trituberculatus]